MSLISIANFQAAADHIGAIYDALVVCFGTRTTGPVAGNAQNLANSLLTLVAQTVNDLTQEIDLGPAMQSCLNNCAAEAVLNNVAAVALSALDAHCRSQGSTVDASIVGVDSYLKYYNGGSGGSLFANMVTPSFNYAWQAVRNTYLTSGNGGSGATTYGAVMSPGINPTNGNAAGLGTYNKATATFTDGVAVTQSSTAGNRSYSEVKLIAVITTDLSGASSAPVVTVTGVDHLGNTGQTWTGTFASNNPAAALTQQTISSGAITAQARATVTVGSTTGIVPGSLVTINSGLADEEVVLVEAVPSGTTFTAVFLKAHDASATVDGAYSLTLTNGSGRRCRDVTGIALTQATAGVIRIEGVEDRKSI